jgi:hypothetical protein
LPELAFLAYMYPDNFRRVFAVFEVQSSIGLEETADGRFRFNARQCLIMLLVADCVRYGMKAPLAGRMAGRIAESLVFDPEAAKVHIEFRQNGASFTFTSDDAPDAAEAAGPARFRLTFDLNAYRAAVDAAMGGSDAA